MKRLLTVLLAVLFLTGCSANQNDDAVKQCVTNFFDGYKKKDVSIAKFLVGSPESDGMNFEGISAYFADNLIYKIKACEKTSETDYSVEVEVETIDFKQLFTDSYNETVDKFGEDGIVHNFMDEMEQNIVDKDYRLSEFECKVKVRNVGDVFKIQMDSSLANALTGGMNEYLASMQESE
ncbi:MAG: lipoprotein [Acutalibacteraceae bacterium]